MPKNSFISFLSIVFIIIFSFSCEKKEKNNCPSFPTGISFPYREPICHPSGKIIGFNHYPLKEIKYTYGLDCPEHATYIYDQEQRGFWLMDIDGQNKRQVLPYFLNCPSWSTDGKYITFSIPYIGIIYKMPFDGENFDTSAIVRLTTSERNFYPTWSPSGKIIAYDNSKCPGQQYECGILMMDTAGNKKELIIKQKRFPFWGRNDDTIFYVNRYFDLINKTEHIIFNTSGFSIEPPSMFNPQKNKIFYKINYTNIPGPTKLYSIDFSGANFQKVSDDPIYDFTFTPDGKIIYHLYDHNQIDEVKNTLWIMDQDGSNKHQLTYNNFITSF